MNLEYDRSTKPPTIYLVPSHEQGHFVVDWADTNVTKRIKLAPVVAELLRGKRKPFQYLGNVNVEDPSKFVLHDHISATVLIERDPSEHVWPERVKHVQEFGPVSLIADNI